MSENATIINTDENADVLVAGTLGDDAAATVTTPDITIVVCTYNRASMLKQALSSLTTLETNGQFHYEILVVDNNSKDDTQAVVSELADAHSVTLRSVVETNQGIVYARNRGVVEACGEWIAFFDDDQIADKKWLLNLLTMAKEKQVLSVGGRVVLQLPENVTRNLAPTCRMLLGETVGLDLVQQYTPRTTPGAGNWMLHKSVFKQVGPFDLAFNKRGEDTDLFLRTYVAGIPGWFTPDALVHHITPPERMDTDYLFRLCELMSEGMAADERQARGKAVYPLIFIARSLQFGLLHVPKWLFAKLTRNQEAELGARCRLRIAGNCLRDGWRLIAGKKSS